MSVTRISIAAATMTLITGCASVNHTVTQIDVDVFSVSTMVYGGFGNASNTPGNITKSHLQRAGSTAQELGCTHFAAIDNAAQNVHRTGITVINEQFQQMQDGSVQYRTAQGQAYRIVKPKQRGNTFVCFKERPSAILPGLIFNAELVAK